MFLFTCGHLIIFIKWNIFHLICVSFSVVYFLFLSKFRAVFLHSNSCLQISWIFFKSYDCDSSFFSRALHSDFIIHSFISFFVFFNNFLFLLSFFVIFCLFSINFFCYFIKLKVVCAVNVVCWRWHAEPIPFIMSANPGSFILLDNFPSYRFAESMYPWNVSVGPSARRSLEATSSQRELHWRPICWRRKFLVH